MTEISQTQAKRALVKCLVLMCIDALTLTILAMALMAANAGVFRESNENKKSGEGIQVRKESSLTFSQACIN